MYLLTVLQTEGQIEVSWGWEFCYLPTIAHSKVNLKFHGGGKFDIFLLVYTLNVNLKFHGGGNFDIFLPLYTLKGLSEVPWGWDLGIFLPLNTFKVNLKFMGFPKGRHAIIGRACGVAQSGDPRSCTIREVAYLQSGWCRIAVGHTMHSKGAWSSVNVECDVVRA